MTDNCAKRVKLDTEGGARAGAAKAGGVADDETRSSHFFPLFKAGAAADDEIRDSWHPNGQPNGPVKKKFAPPRKSNISLERVLRGFGNWPAIAMISQLRQRKVGKRYIIYDIR